MMLPELKYSITGYRMEKNRVAVKCYRKKVSSPQDQKSKHITPTEFLDLMFLVSINLSALRALMMLPELKYSITGYRMEKNRVAVKGL